MVKEEFLNKLVNTERNKNVFEEMKESQLPLIMFGGGSMSYSIRKLLRKEHIEVAACWIDNCSENESIDGIPVLNLEMIKKRYNKINVVFGHSKYELEDIIMEENPFINKCYCLVNVCYGQWKAITYDFVRDHVNEYIDTYELLEDEMSKECMIAYLNCKLEEDYRFLLPVCQEISTYFDNPFFTISENEDYVDIGAYNGDTIREFLQSVQSYSNIYGIEPENKSFDELVAYVKNNNLECIELHNCGCWDSDTVLKLKKDEESSTIAQNGDEEINEYIYIDTYMLDSLLKNRTVTLVKINFLNGVVETLKGAKEILNKQKPRLIITVGFDEWGIINIPQIIKEINPEYKMGLRYAAAMPARLILFAY